MLENVERKGQNIIWQGKYKEDNGKRKDGNSKGKKLKITCLKEEVASKKKKMPKHYP